MQRPVRDKQRPSGTDPMGKSTWTKGPRQEMYERGFQQLLRTHSEPQSTKLRKLFDIASFTMLESTLKPTNQVALQIGKAKGVWFTL